jgi:hypothetical protein
MQYACAAAAKRIRKVGLTWLRIYGGPEISGLLAAVLAFGLVRAAGGPNPASKLAEARAITAFKAIARAGLSHGLKVI